MKVLFVTGGDGAAMFVEDELGIEKAVQLAEDNGGKYVYDDYVDYAELEILTFGEVDKEFVKFINWNLIDYDQSKDTNYFIID